MLFEAVGQDEKCIVDKTKPASEEGNYMDCTDETLVAQGKTDCCAQDGSVGCCKPGERWVLIPNKGQNIQHFHFKTSSQNLYIQARGSIEFYGGRGATDNFVCPPPGLIN